MARHKNSQDHFSPDLLPVMQETDNRMVQQMKNRKIKKKTREEKAIPASPFLRFYVHKNES